MIASSGCADIDWSLKLPAEARFKKKVAPQPNSRFNDPENKETSRHLGLE